MSAISNFVVSHPGVTIVILMFGGVGLWQLWDLSIRPRLIPRAEIDRSIDELYRQFGNDAVRVVLARLDHAQRYCHTDEEGELLRILRVMRRRTVDASPKNSPRRVQARSRLMPERRRPASRR